MAKYKFTAARRVALNKARRKWMKMSPAKRREVMPASHRHLEAHIERHGARYVAKKRYPIGKTITLDVGRKGHHYVHARKVKNGWVVGPLRSKEYLQKHAVHARRKWVKMSPAARAKAMPGGRKKRK